MFIDRIPNRRSPPAILLRESFRQDGKSRKRTLANLSRLPEHVVVALDALLKGTTQTPSSDTFDIVRTLPHGHAAAVLGSLRNCGIDRVIAPRRSPQRDLVAGMIAARILEPSSKLAMVRRFASKTATSTLADELRLPAEEIDENLLYEAMDWLVERQEAVERRLARKHLEEGALVLYDMTSAWSYSRCCPLVRHGYSRDGKKGVPQIEFGLLCDRAGWPVAIEAFKGNTADPSTVAAQIGKLRRRFKLSRVVLVGDRGMLTDARIREDVKPAGLDWISALRAPGVRALVANGALQPSLFDERDMAEITCEELYPGERLVVCRNPLLAKERARKREDLLRAAETALEAVAEATKRSKNRLKGEKNISERVGRAVAKYKMKKHFILEIAADTFSWRRNDDSIAAEAALDGFYVVRTSLPEEQLDAGETVAAYKNLSVVERAFRTFKLIDLNVRPIHHRLESRVRAHLLLCMLAYYVERHMRQQLAPMLFDDEDGPVRTSIVAPAEKSNAAQRKASSRRTPDGHTVHSFRSLLDDLSTIARNRVRPRIAGAREFEMTTIPTPLQEKALRLLNVRLGPQP